MRGILWVCILAAQLAGQTVTTITGRFVSAAGVAETGSCTFTPTGSFAVNGPYYVTGPAAKCSIAAGSLAGANGTGACALIPTDGVLAQRYWMECMIDQRNPAGAVVRSVSQGRALVQVPTSATPLDIATLVVSYTPPPGIMVQWSQFAQGERAGGTGADLGRKFMGARDNERGWTRRGGLCLRPHGGGSGSQRGLHLLTTFRSGGIRAVAGADLCLQFQRDHLQHRNGGCDERLQCHRWIWNHLDLWHDRDALYPTPGQLQSGVQVHLRGCHPRHAGEHLRHGFR